MGHSGSACQQQPRQRGVLVMRREERARVVHECV